VTPSLCNSCGGT